MFWSPVITSYGGEIWWLGFIWVGVSLFTSIGSYFSGKVEANKTSMAFSMIFVAIPMLLTVFFPNVYWIVAFFLVHEIGRGSVVPITFVWSNKYIPDHIRSTTNSVRSSIGTIGRAVGLLFFGYLSEFKTPLETWFIAASFMILLSFYVFASKKS